MSNRIKSTLEKVCLAEKGSIISGPFGSSISSKFFVETGVPVIRGNNLSLSYDKYYDTGYVFVTEEKAKELKCYAYPGDLIFTAAGTIGQVGIIPEDSEYSEYVISNKQIRARIDTSKVDLLYAYYWFSSPWIKKTLIKSNKGSTVPLLTLNEIKALPIEYPEDLQEQKRIAQTIDVLSRKIETNRKISKVLQDKAKLIYDYWFTQFDFPDKNGRSYKSSGGEMRYSYEIKKEVPNDWEVKPLSTVCRIVLGGTPDTTKSSYWNGDISWLNSGETAQFPVIKTAAKITTEGLNNSATVLMPKGTVIVSITGNIRSSFLSIETCANQSVVGVYESERIKKDYIYPYISNMVRYYTTLSTGNCQQHINKGTIEDSLIVIPSSTILHEYYKLTNPLYAEIESLGFEIDLLEQQRDWLLPMLMNGQVIVNV